MEKEVFITYSWDNEEHQQQVLAFCKFLRGKGFNATVDVALLQEESAMDLVKMMHKSIGQTQKVIIVLSEGYKAKADKFKGGVGQEYELIIKDITDHPTKYILVSFSGISNEIVPLNFKGREIVDLSKPDNVKKLFSKLLDLPLYNFGEIASKKPEIPVLDINTFNPFARKEIHEIDWRYYIPYYMETFDEGDSETEDFDTFKDKLKPVWHPKKEEIWESKITKGYFKLINKTDPKAVRYIWIDVKEKDMGQALVSVEVDFKENFGAPIFGAGLIYRFQENTKHYYAFIINQEKQFGFYLRDENGYTPILSGVSQHIQDKGFNKVAISCDNQQMNLYVNEHLILTNNTISLGAGYTGIVAIGGGEFVFDNFSLYDL